MSQKTAPLLLTDADVLRLLSPTESVAVIEEVFKRRAQGDYAGSPRWSGKFGASQMTFTVGGNADLAGFRVYFHGGFEADDQLTAVWDAQSGALIGVVVGAVLGALRTGSIGGVAVKHLARFEATSLALIGTGQQAFTQLQAVLASRLALQEVRVYSRQPQNRAAFIEDVQAISPRRVRFINCPDAESAVRGADVVIGATNSIEPVIKGEWLKAGAHVSTVGPKGQTRREVDQVVVERAGLVVSDSPEQARAYPTGLIIDGTSHNLYDLSAVVTGQVGRPSDDAITLFISSGLAGTEVALAAHLLQKAKRESSQTE